MRSSKPEFGAPAGPVPDQVGLSQESNDAEDRQRRQYDRIASRYEEHYYDPWGLAYRHRFVDGLEAEGLDLRGKVVLDGMCGGGPGAEYLSSLGAEVVALDISDEWLAILRRRIPHVEAKRGSMLQTGFPDNHFDAVFITFALHHVHPHTTAVVEEVHRILKPGGIFAFAEPHSGALVNLPRRLWYRFDHFFEENEAALDIDQLEHAFRGQFVPVDRRYLGGPAYLLVMNSLIFRIPVRFKPYFSPLLLRLEAFLARFQGPQFSMFAVVRWRRCS